MARTSPAMANYKRSLATAAALMRIERKFHDPPRANEVASVEGLRGGAAVIMVAAFEQFLVELCPELLSPVRNPYVQFQALPPEMQTRSVFGTLEGAMKAPRYVPRTSLSLACQTSMSRRAQFSQRK